MSATIVIACLAGLGLVAAVRVLLLLRARCARPESAENELFFVRHAPASARREPADGRPPSLNP